MEDYVKTTMYEHGVLKDKEISTLHREIRDELRNMNTEVSLLKTMVMNHDALIQEVRQMYKTANTIKKLFLTVIVGIPTIAACISSAIYMYRQLFNYND